MKVTILYFSGTGNTWYVEKWPRFKMKKELRKVFIGLERTLE